MRKVRNYFCLIILVFTSSLAFADCKLFNNSFIADFKEKTPKADNAFIFFDGSLNMEGFVKKDEINISEVNYNYLKVIDKIPFAVASLSNNQFFQKYFTGIKTITANEVLKTSRPEFYTECPPNIPEGQCHLSKSKISKVLDTISNLISKDQKNLFIIISDLSLSNEELVGKNIEKIKEPFIQALNSDQAIGVFGINSKFNGNIWGLPSGRKYEQAYERPFFIIAIGPDDLVTSFKKLIDSEALNQIPEKDYNFNLYSNTLIKNPLTAENFSSENFIFGKGILENNFYDNVDYTQISFSKRHDPLAIQLDLNNIQVPYTPYLQSISANAEIAELKDDSCREYKLNNENKIKFLIEKSQTDSLITYNFQDFSNKDSNLLRRGREYVLRVNFIANSIDDQRAKWFDEWSYDQTQEDELVNNGVDFFPVLNLSNFGLLLSQIQNENFTEQKLGEMIFLAEIQ